MNPHTKPKTLRLDPRESLVLDHAAGIEIECLRGGLWITQYGDNRDIVLTPGRSFELSLPSSTVLSSLHGAEFALQRIDNSARRAPRPAWTQRLLRWIAPAASRLVQPGLEGRIRIERVL